ncbi:RNA 2'-phosphotransferase [Paenibacillus glycinis]|uniref:RNA 2'-phosphotransferase n=1 Tax=Paenibacillus glycinis TaxID=2697035 RepID=UPI00191BF4F2|nr:RNA 2'-phosphotransferase [Paenibacillus glycinis]
MGELLAGCKQAGKALDLETLERIVRENDKQRYRFNADRSKIRANQGHSLSVDVELKEAVPPEALYHGTVQRFLENIQAEGIRKRSRQHVHLSADIRTAVNVGDRRGEAIVLRIDASAMHRDGHRFHLSENGVWLCDVVPWQYVAVLDEDRQEQGERR